LEDYAEQLPELMRAGEVPLELIYEEYSQRLNAGEHVTLDQYRQRFPQQAAALERLFRSEATRECCAVYERQQLGTTRTSGGCALCELLTPNGRLASQF
jgi:hypothetical protein